MNDTVPLLIHLFYSTGRATSAFIATGAADVYKCHKLHRALSNQRR